MNWKEIWNKFVAFIRNNTTFSTVILLIILALFFTYRHQLIQSGIELGKGTVNLISGGVRTTPEEIVKAVENNEKLTVLKDETGKSYVVSSGKSLPTTDEVNPIKVIGITNLKEVGEGVAWQVGKIGVVNADIPITTIGVGIGGSYDITKSAFIGGGAIVDYSITDFKDIPQHTSLGIYGGWRF